MKNHRFFVSTLIAAAAMTATAYAEMTPTLIDAGTKALSFSETANEMSPGSDYNSSDYTLTFSVTSGYFGSAQGSNEIFNQNIVISELTSVNGWGQQITTFAGAVTGLGTFTIKDAGLAQDFVFTGDLSGYTGKIDSTQTYSTSTALGNTTSGIIQFGSTSATVASVSTNISGQGEIVTTGGLRYSYAAGEETLVVGNSSITAGGIEFQGGASYTVKNAVTAGTLTLSAGSLTLNGNTTVSSALTVASGTTLTNAGTLDLSGATVSLSSAITNTGTVTASAETVFSLANLGGVRSGNQTAFTLVDGETTTWADDMGVGNVNLSGSGIAGRGASASFADGVVTVTDGTAGNLVWAGTDGNNMWDYSASNWTMDGNTATFMNKDNVTFASPEEGVSTTVALSENIEVGTMQVSGDYTFSGKGYTLAGTTLTVDSGKTLTLAGNSSPLFRFDDIQLSGTIDYRVNNTVSSDSWNKLTFAAEDANLYIYDNTANGLSIGTVQIDSASSITATWGGTVNIGALVGDKALSIMCMSGGAEQMNVNITDASQYTGVLTVSSATAYSLVATVDACLGGTIVANTGSTVWLAMNAEGKEATFDASKVDTTGGGTLAGVAVSAGTLNVSSNVATAQVSGGTLNVSGSEIASMNISGGTLNVSGSEIASMNISGGTTNFSESRVTTGISQTTGESTILGTVSVDARLSLSKTGTLNIGDGKTDTNVSIERLYTSDSGASGTNTLNVKGTLSVTGSANLDSNTYQNLSVLLGHWNGTSITNVSGVFNAIDAVTYFAYTSKQSAKMEVLSGGVVNTLGLSGGAGWSGTSEFVLNTSGRVNIGSKGVSQMDIVTLNGGTVGAYADWTSDQAMTVNGDVVVDTGHYDVATKTTTDNGHNITLSGVLSGTGKLIKTGEGTLVLYGEDDTTANIYQGGTEIRGGTLKVQYTGWSNGTSGDSWNRGDIGGHIYQDLLQIFDGGTLEVVKAQNTTNEKGYGNTGALRGFSVMSGTGTYKYSGEDTSYISVATDENTHIGIADSSTSEGRSKQSLVFDVVNQSATLDVSKVIAAIGSNGAKETDGALEKVGAGTLILSEANKYTGGTTISEGTLVAANASALGAGAVNISGGKLEVRSGVEVSNNITVILGDTLDAAVIIGDGSLGGTITLDYVAPAENAALMIATETTTKTYTLLSGNVGSNLTAASFALGSGWESGWEVSDYAYNTETGIGTLTMTIPEPSAFGLLAGVGALALCVSRRRRNRR